MYYHIFIFVVIRKYIGIIFSEVQERVSMATKFGRPRIKRNNESRQKNEQKKKTFITIYLMVYRRAHVIDHLGIFLRFFFCTRSYIYFFFFPHVVELICLILIRPVYRTDESGPSSRVQMDRRQ